MILTMKQVIGAELSMLCPETSSSPRLPRSLKLASEIISMIN